MTTKKNTATQEKATRRAYGPRKPKYVLVVEVAGTAFASVEAWHDREYAEFRAAKIEGSTVMQRGKAE